MQYYSRDPKRSSEDRRAAAHTGDTTPPDPGRKRPRKPPKRIRRREPATVDQAVGMALWGKGLGGSALVIGTRVGSADFVPRGYGLADCSECSSPLWINPDVVEAIERRGTTVVPICFPCSGLEGR